jgi:predicted dehydrogenase
LRAEGAERSRCVQGRTARGIDRPVDIYEDYRQLLQRDDLDVVSICTPPFAHKEPVMEALRNGKHVLCEKPLAPSLQDCDDMIEASRRYGKKLAVVFQYRFRQDFKQLKHVVQSGVLGPLLLAQMNGLY